MAKSTTKASPEAGAEKLEKTSPPSWDEELAKLLAPASADLSAGKTVYVSLDDKGHLSAPIFREPPDHPFVSIRKSTQGAFMTQTGAPVARVMNPDRASPKIPKPEDRAGTKQPVEAE